MQITHEKLGKGTIIDTFDYEGIELALVGFEDENRVVPLDQLSEIDTEEHLALDDDAFDEIMEEVTSEWTDVLNDLEMLPDTMDGALEMVSRTALLITMIKKALYD